MQHQPHPRRVQVTGDMFHPHLPDGAHWAGRRRPKLPASPFANPHPIDAGRKTPCPLCGIRHTLAESLNLYRQHLDQNPDLACLAAVAFPHARLACRCPLDQPCHVDELLNRADQVAVIPLGDDRDTTHIVQTIPVSTGECGACNEPAVIAVRNTIDQQHPDETSTIRASMCTEHQDDATRIRAAWEADARKHQDPAERARFLASAGVAS